MSDAWARAERLIDKHTGDAGGIFVRLTADGDKVVGAFCGDPHAREVHWTGDRYVDCSETEDCPTCAEGKRPSGRFAFNFFLPAENAMKVIEGGTQWVVDVMKVRDKYGLDAWTFELQRHGATGDPKTKYTILPEEKLGAADRARIAATPLHDLARVLGGGTAAAETSITGAPGPPAGATVSADVGRELAERLNRLSPPDRQGFLKLFGIERMRDLRAADEVQARAYIAKHSDKRQPATGLY